MSELLNPETMAAIQEWISTLMGQPGLLATVGAAITLLWKINHLIRNKKPRQRWQWQKEAW